MAELTIDSIIEEYRPKCLAALETFLPRAFSNEAIVRFFGEPLYAFDVDSATKSLLVPIWDLLDRGGKAWRPILMCLVTECLNGNQEISLPLTVLCEMAHNGTLMVDDVEDDSKLRRGKECIHILFGVDIAINAGNALYFLPLLIFKDYRERNQLTNEQLVRCYEMYNQELLNVHLGQGLDIYWHQGHKNPNVDEYLQMCAYKTGVLARLSARLGAYLNGAGEDLIKAIGRFAESIGVAFQIQDDLLNIEGGEMFAKKISYVGEDIHEGKRSLMVIHSLKHAPEDQAAKLLDILNSHTTDQAVINDAIAILHSTDSLTYARKVAKEIVEKAWGDIEPLLPANEAKTKLQVFADYLISRKT